MASKRRARHDEHGLRVRHLIALDSTNVMRRLTARREEMVSLFSRLRSRDPMLETVHSTFGTAGFPELTRLGISEQRAVNAFYESLAELRWYLRYTEDMPGTVRKTLVQHIKRLQHAYERLISAFGQPAPDSGPVVDADVVEPDPAPALPERARN